jgi:steroid delta-isomerase-like uncharacterized protein
MQDDNTAIVMAYYDAWDAADASGLDPFVAEDFVGHDPSLGPDFDRETLKQRVDGLRAALPGFQVAREGVVAQDDQVVVRWRTDGTFAGGASETQPDGVPVSFTGTTWYRIRDGRIAELWNEWDNMRFLTAIGAAPDSSVAAG